VDVLATTQGWFGARCRTEPASDNAGAGGYAGRDEGLQTIPVCAPACALDDYGANVIGSARDADPAYVPRVVRKAGARGETT